MNYLKQKLIRLGSKNPKLRSDIRPVLDWMKTAQFELSQMMDEIYQVMEDYYGWELIQERQVGSGIEIHFEDDEHEKEVYIHLSEGENGFDVFVQNPKRGKQKSWDDVQERGMMKTTIHRTMHDFFPNIKRAEIQAKLAQRKEAKSNGIKRVVGKWLEEINREIQSTFNDKYRGKFKFNVSSTDAESLGFHLSVEELMSLPPKSPLNGIKRIVFEGQGNLGIKGSEFQGQIRVVDFDGNKSFQDIKLDLNQVPESIARMLVMEMEYLTE